MTVLDSSLTISSQKWIFLVVTSSNGASNCSATLFCQTRLGFEFDLGLIGSSFLDLFLLLVQRFEVNHQQQKLTTSCVHHNCRFRTFTCRIWGIDSPTLCSECVMLIKTRQRSSAWALLVGKHQQNQNFLFFSNLRHIESCYG